MVVKLVTPIKADLRLDSDSLGRPTHQFGHYFILIPLGLLIDHRQIKIFELVTFPFSLPFLLNGPHYCNLPRLFSLHHSHHQFSVIFPLSSWEMVLVRRQEAQGVLEFQPWLTVPFPNQFQSQPKSQTISSFQGHFQPLIRLHPRNLKHLMELSLKI